MSQITPDMKSVEQSSQYPIESKQEVSSLQNPQFENCQSVLDNSFIELKKSFQTIIQNINFSDHTPSFNENRVHIYQPHNQSENYRIIQQEQQSNETFKQQKLITSKLLNKHRNQLQINQQSQKEYFQSNEHHIEQEDVSMNEEFSQSLNDKSKGVDQKKCKKQILTDDLKMTHKDHMLLGGKIISGLQKNIVSLPFREPVDVQRFKIPDYFEIIKQPMDLRTIKKKISNQDYCSIEAIYSDIELIITNSMKYNQFNPDFIKLTKNFQKSYYKIRRYCQRIMRKFKLQGQKKAQDRISVEKLNRKTLKTIENSFHSNQVEIISNFSLKQLTKLAKKIKKFQPQEQIQLFKQINIINTMVIDIKTLTTKQIKSLIKQVEKIEKSKQEFIRNQEKKENSHLTTCDHEFRQAS